MSQTRSVVPSSIDDTNADELTRPRTELTVPATNSTPLVPGPRESVEAARRLVVNRGADAGTVLAVTRPRTMIGRQRDADIVLDDVTVSRRHAELVHQNGRTILVDGDSLNGTYVNRRPVEQVELADGDEIWIGKVRFTFREDG